MLTSDVREDKHNNNNNNNARDDDAAQAAAVSPFAAGPIPCQRWRNGVDRLLHPVEDGRSSFFDKRNYSVDVVEERVAREFVTTHHYSASYPAAVLRVGLFGRRANLLGVAVFSVPMNERVVPFHCGVPPRQGVELGRFVLLDSDEAPRNSESYFLKRALATLRVEKPEMKSVVSYCDPVPRIAADGTVRLRGHIGTVYQSSNARYVGRASARTLHMLSDGTILSPRTVSKIRLEEVGCQAAERYLEQLGAPKREHLMSPAAWVKSILDSALVTKVRHPGNHVFLFPLAKGKGRARIEERFAPALAYPKQVDAVSAAFAKDNRLLAA